MCNTVNMTILVITILRLVIAVAQIMKNVFFKSDCSLWGAPGCSLWGTPGCSLCGTPGCSLWGTPGCSLWGAPGCSLWGAPGTHVSKSSGRLTGFFTRLAQYRSIYVYCKFITAWRHLKSTPWIEILTHTVVHFCRNLNDEFWLIV